MSEGQAPVRTGRTEQERQNQPSSGIREFLALKGIGIFSAGVAGGYGIKTYQSGTRE